MPKRADTQGTPQGKSSPRKQRVLQPQGGYVSQMLTIDQVAARLCVHRTTVYDFINLSGLPVTRLAPHAVRIDEADLKIWVERRKDVS